MLSWFRATAAVTVLSLGMLASAQTWGSTYAIQGIVHTFRPWVEATGSPLDVAINFISKPTSSPIWFEWFIQSAENSTDPSTHVNILNSLGGFASPFGGDPRVCGGQGMLLRTTFTGFPTVWELIPLGNDQYKISTNITPPNSGGVSSQVFWSIHGSTGLLPLDPEDRTTCTDSGGISQVFQLLPPEALN